MVLVCCRVAQCAWETAYRHAAPGGISWTVYDRRYRETSCVIK